MNNRNKLIELFIYIVIVVVDIVLLLTGGADDKTSAENMGGESYAVVLDEYPEKQPDRPRCAEYASARQETGRPVQPEKFRYQRHAHLSQPPILCGGCGVYRGKRQ